MKASAGVLAQLVERLNGIEEVTGSNPVGSSLRLERSAKRGCHAGVKRRRATNIVFIYQTLQDYGLAGQIVCNASFMFMS